MKHKTAKHVEPQGHVEHQNLLQPVPEVDVPVEVPIERPDIHQSTLQCSNCDENSSQINEIEQPSQLLQSLPGLASTIESNPLAQQLLEEEQMAEIIHSEQALDSDSCTICKPKLTI